MKYKLLKTSCKVKIRHCNCFMTILMLILITVTPSSWADNPPDYPKLKCPDPSIDFVISSFKYSDPNRTWITSPRLDKIVTIAKSAGFKVKTLYDKDATKMNILNYLSCPNVKVYLDNGDGEGESFLVCKPPGISQMLSPTVASRLKKAKSHIGKSICSVGGILSSDINHYFGGGKLKGKAILLDDCQTFLKGDPGSRIYKNSLRDAFKTNAQASLFVGGVSILPPARATNVFTCALREAFSLHQKGETIDKFADIIKLCMKAQGLSTFEIGADQDSQYTLKAPTPIKQSVWRGIDINIDPSISDVKKLIVGVGAPSSTGNSNADINSVQKNAITNCVAQKGKYCDSTLSNLEQHIEYTANCYSINLDLNAFSVPGKRKIYVGFGSNGYYASVQSTLMCSLYSTNCYGTAVPVCTD